MKDEVKAALLLLHPSSFILHPLSSPFRVAVYLDARAGNLGLDGRDDTLGQVVRAEEALVADDFEVQLDELDGAGAARAQAVEADDALRAEAADAGGHRHV